MANKSQNDDDLMNNLSGYSSNGSKGVDPLTIGLTLASVGSNIYTSWRSRQLAQEQNQWNIAQWQRENAYNTPVAQMARLTAAGINPALAYSNGDLMNEAAASPQLTNGRVMSPVQIDPLTAAQVENLKAQSKATEHQTIREDEKQGLILQQMAADIDKTSSQIAELGSQVELNKILGSEASQRVDNLKLDWKKTNDSLSDYLRDMHAKADLSVQEAHFAAERLDSAIQSAWAYTDYLAEQTHYISYNAQTNRIEAKTGSYKAAADVMVNIKELRLKSMTAMANVREANARIQKYLSETKTIDQKRFGELLNQYVSSYAELQNANSNMIKALASIAN